MRAQTGRADLLRALHLGCTGPLPLMHDDHHCWGFFARKETLLTAELHAPMGTVTGQMTVGSPAASPPSFRNPLRMPEVWLATLHEREEEEEEEDDETEAVRPIDSAELVPPDEPQVAYQDMVPLPRLLRALENAFAQLQHRGLHLPALVQAAARRQWPSRMPLRPMARWCPELIVALDFSMALYPYRHDMHRVVALLRRHFSQTALRVWVGEYGPNGAWRPYPTKTQTPAAKASAFPWPQQGEALLLVSDLGLLSASANATENPWQIALKRAKVRPVVLAPWSPDDGLAHGPSPARVVRWSPDSRLRAETLRARQAQPHHTAALDQLLASVAAYRRVDPPLLRALRSNLNTSVQNASLEGRLWAHPHVAAGHWAEIRQAHEAQHRNAFTQNPVAHKNRVRELAQQHHAHWPRALAAVETLRWLACSRDHPGFSPALGEVRHFLDRLLASTQQGPDAAVQQTVAYLLRNADDAFRDLAGDLLHRLSNGFDTPGHERMGWALMQRGQGLWLVPQDTAMPPGVVLVQNLGHAAPGQSVLWQTNTRSVPLKLSHNPMPLPEPEQDARLWLGGNQTHVRRQPRFVGIDAWSQSGQGAKAAVTLPWGERAEFSAAFPRMQWSDQPSQAVKAVLRQDTHGIQLEMTLAHDLPATVVMGFRYIPPGTFLMGSPEGVGESDEHPQHPVTLTEGFWLAETPCTQSLWQAVMGSNPSHFKKGKDASRRPVDSVSHEDVTTFLNKLKALLPKGVQAVLPSEAQWEYAARAGTQTAYWWGDEFDPSRANTDGTGKKRYEAKEGTTSVDRYPPNPWGLHDMHGNVWEWCADGGRTYEAKAEVNPVGETAGPAFAVRGGSWIDIPGGARAAFRLRWHDGDRLRLQGFRFALRPSSPVLEGTP